MYYCIGVGAAFADWRERAINLSADFDCR